MLYWLNSIAFLVLFVETAQGAVSQTISVGRFYTISGPFLLSNASSSEIVNVMGVTAGQTCQTECLSRGCLLVSLIPSSQQCQMLMVNDASRGPGPAGTHVQRLLGSEPDARLWAAENFTELLVMRMLNITIEIRNSSTGRNGSVQSVTIPSTGCYRIEVAGARGGSNAFSGMSGGNGAYMSGAFNLTAGTQLTVVVGQAGGPPNLQHSGGGGGGGSFVYLNTNNRLLIVAGGGGAGTYSKTGLPGEAGTNGTDTRPYGDAISYGGIDGQPGFNNPSAMPTTHNHGGCGAGWLGKPVNPRRGPDDGEGGGSRTEGWVGGVAGGMNTGAGGFGGGGGGGVFYHVWGAAGAGGGYSGGGTGYSTGPPGGGGGSFCSGSACSGSIGGNAGAQGLVVIRLLVPVGNSCHKE